MFIDVWGVVFELENANDDLLEAIYDEFAGSVKMSTSNHAYHKIIFEHDLTHIFKKEFIRHKGGSSGKKYFTNGDVFDSSVQERFVRLPDSAELGSLFFADQIVCYSTSSVTHIFSSTPPHYLINDIIENLLLNKARSQDWVQAHASAWVSDGAAKIAIGNSGAGKTTRALQHVVSGSTLLGNDRVFFRVSNNKLQARGFPLPINIGCGTIRNLALPIDHLDKKDDEKIRLTPKEVNNIFKPIYDQWFDVEHVFCPSRHVIEENIYWTEDDCHPSWNPATHRSMNRSNKDRVLTLLDATITYGALF